MRFPKILLKKYCFAILFSIPLLMSCGILDASEKDNREFPNDPRVDRSFATKLPCKAPCWYGLNLGEATPEDIRTTLPSLAFVDSTGTLEQKISNDPDEILFLVHCVYSKPSEACAWLETSPEGKLRKIILEVLYPLSLRDAIDQLGIPKYYISDPSPTKDICQIHIYWPDASIMVSVEKGPKEQYCMGKRNERINLDIQIESLTYTGIDTENIKREGLPWPNTP